MLKFVQEAVEKAAPSQELKAGQWRTLLVYDGAGKTCICRDVWSMANVGAVLSCTILCCAVLCCSVLYRPDCCIPHCPSPTSPPLSLSSGMPQLMVQDGEKLGRRKAMAGKESGPTVTAVESTSQSNAVSERDAMALLTRFQFPSKRW